MQETKNLIKIFFDPMNKEIKVKRGTVLLNAMRDAGIQIESICGGKGECGKCKVLLVKGEASHSSSKHENFLSKQEISEGYRLACQIRVLIDSELTVPVESLVANPKILAGTEMSIERLDPASKKYLVLSPSTQDDKPRLIRLEGYSGPTPEASDEIFDSLFSMDLEQPITATLSRTNSPPEVINIEPNDRTGSNYGLAVDVGTTTIVVLLADF